jgi:hypothetical protein
VSRQNDRRILIVVTNGLNGQRLTSLFQAKRYVARGLARWVGGALEFVRYGGDHRETSAQRLCQITYDCAARRGLAELEAVRHLPVVGPPIQLFTKKPKVLRRAPKGRNGSVKIVMRDGVRAPVAITTETAK